MRQPVTLKCWGYLPPLCDLRRPQSWTPGLCNQYMRTCPHPMPFTRWCHSVSPVLAQSLRIVVTNDDPFHSLTLMNRTCLSFPGLLS